MAEIGIVNAGLIRRDLSQVTRTTQALRAMGIEEIVRRLSVAGELFETAGLPLGDSLQSPDDYVACVSATNGLPRGLVRKNMTRLSSACQQVSETLVGALRGIDPAVLDRGWTSANGLVLAFSPVAEALCVLLPNNSPGVNALWIPAIALKTSVVLKPGREEPWTPYRLIQACIQAGLPPEAFSFYPTDHVGSAEILAMGRRIMMFGDEHTVTRYAGDVRVQAHGPGWSKVVIGEDCIDRWPDFIDVCLSSILENGGRSCINASTIVVPRWGDAVARALAERLASVVPTPLDAEHGQIAAFASPRTAEDINRAIEAGLDVPGAHDVTARYRTGGRLVTYDGAAFLNPTVVYCDSFTHPLACREYPFPYAAVVEIPQSKISTQIGRSLVVSAITADNALIRDLLHAPGVGYLHVGAVPTWQVRRDQPHEGNLFDFLYQQRGLQWADLSGRMGADPNVISARIGA